jgi:lipoprotein-releasing system ATP-binding protein
MMITVDALRKAYLSGGRTIHVLKGAGLRIEDGEAVALMGPSGVGKSTLLHLVAGLDRPDSGSITVAGQDVTQLRGNALDQFRRSTIGIIYQFHFLLPEFTAIENVMMPAVVAGVKSSEARERAQRLLGEVGLVDRERHLPSKLSGGEQQRVAIARALMNRPRLLLADEPTGNLDEETAGQAFDLLMGLKANHGLTILMATHNPALAGGCSRTLRLRDGKIE